MMPLYVHCMVFVYVNTPSAVYIGSLPFRARGMQFERYLFDHPRVALQKSIFYCAMRLSTTILSAAAAS